MRLTPPDPADYSNEQRRVHEQIASGPRGRVRGPLAIWLHRPQLAEAAQALGAYCRYDTTLAPRLSELAILIMAVSWQAEFEWFAHKPIALAAGLEPEVVEALRTGQPPVFTDPEAEIVHRVTVSLAQSHTLPDDLYTRALEVLGRDRLVDLVGLCGYYTLISMTLVAFDVPLPEGSAPELGALR